MPIGYLDVPAGADLDVKRRLMTSVYDALHDVYPFPDDTRIFLREWPLETVSQNGRLGAEPARPVLVLHVPAGGDPDAKRTMVAGVDEAVRRAYGLPDFVIFFHEHTVDTVALHGGLLADDRQRVEDQAAVYAS